MRKININKVIFMFICSVGIGLGCFASSISLLTKNILLQVMLLCSTYFLGIMIVKVRNKYNLFKD